MSRASNGAYWERLDHFRAIAAFQVFTWHFIHLPSTADHISMPVLAPLDQGHTGVSLFMTLSGYLFAKLIDDRRIDYGGFLFNRVLRLGPLLALSLLLYCPALYSNLSLLETLKQTALGLLLPTWPLGLWSIATELQFYVFLPVILWLARRSPWSVLAVLALAAGLRAALYVAQGSVQEFAYYTLGGRIDQFALGLLAWRICRGRTVSARVMAPAAVAFLLFYGRFDLIGGLHGTLTSPLWISMPTIEALFYALLIAWYDAGRWSLPRPFAFVGKLSFSIYVWHQAPATFEAKLLSRVFDLSAFLPALIASTLSFVAFLPIAWLSWKFLERPALSWRRPYVRTTSGAAPPPAAAKASTVS